MRDKAANGRGFIPTPGLPILPPVLDVAANQIIIQIGNSQSLFFNP
jgi:hypothetical protein